MPSRKPDPDSCCCLLKCAASPARISNTMIERCSRPHAVTTDRFARLMRRLVGRKPPCSGALKPDPRDRGADERPDEPLGARRPPTARQGPGSACDMVPQPRFEAEEMLRLIETHRVTHMHIVPTMFVRLLRLPAEVRARYDLSSLRLGRRTAPRPASRR